MKIDKQKILEGLKIISGDLLPPGWIFTSDDGQDREQENQMVKWLNDINVNPQTTTLGGAFYGLAVEMAKRMYEALKSEQKG